MEELHRMDPYDEHMCAYLALCVEQKFWQSVKQSKYKCAQCPEVLSASDDKINDNLLALKGGELNQPSSSTFKIVIFGNAVMKKCEEYNQKKCFNAISKAIHEHVHDLYNTFYTHHLLLAEQELEESTPNLHKKEFNSQLIKEFLTIKSRLVASRMTEAER